MSNNKQKSRVSAFKETRKSHLFESAEDYTELVADLIEAKGQARVKDIAEFFGISHVTALRTIDRLQREGYLFTEPRAPIELTTKGAKLAQFCKTRHEILIEYFIALGVPEKVAAIDVEGVEHHISKITLEKIKQHLKKLKSKKTR